MSCEPIFLYLIYTAWICDRGHKKESINCYTVKNCSVLKTLHLYNDTIVQMQEKGRQINDLKLFKGAQIL